jgi:hypothetical protein
MQVSFTLYLLEIDFHDHLQIIATLFEQAGSNHKRIIVSIMYGIYFLVL